MRFSYGFAALLVALMWFGTAQAQDQDYGRVSNISTDVAKEVNSPFCPGKTLAMCTSPAAAEVRRDIQGMAKQGMTKDEIKAKLISEYGEEYRLVEPPSADNYGLFILIAFGLLLAAGAISMLSRGKSDAKAAAETTDADDPYLNDLRDQYQD